MNNKFKVNKNNINKNLSNLFTMGTRKEASIQDHKQKAFDNSQTIQAQLKNLLSLDQKVYGRYLVSTDPIQGKIPKNEVEEIISSSIICGKEEAEKLQNKFGKIPLEEMVNNLNINVSYKDTQGLLDYVYFGLFESPNNITIYEGNIAAATNLLQETKISHFNNIDFNDIVLAHELFHFIEHHDKTLYSNTRIIDLWSIGKLYTHTSPLICPGEIAGMSFAKNLLGLDFDPNVLNYIFLLAYDFDEANKLYRRIMRYA